MEIKFNKLENLGTTKSTLKKYADVLSYIKGSLTPHQKNWEEYSLKIYTKGLTTTPIPYKTENKIEALDLNLNFNEHKLKIFAGKNRDEILLTGQSQKEFIDELKAKLNTYGINMEFTTEKFTSTEKRRYNKAAVEQYWDVLRSIYFAMLKFKGNIIEETSNINFWTHHFDLAMLWFSGNIIEGENPDNWDYSREQMNFGFSAGDSVIIEPYFYITAYPFPGEAVEHTLPDKAYWHTKSWNGSVLKYNDLISAEEPFNELIEYFEKVLSLFSELMKK